LHLGPQLISLSSLDHPEALLWFTRPQPSLAVRLALSAQHAQPAHLPQPHPAATYVWAQPVRPYPYLPVVFPVTHPVGARGRRRAAPAPWPPPLPAALVPRMATTRPLNRIPAARSRAPNPRRRPTRSHPNRSSLCCASLGIFPPKSAAAPV
jgi:hypothetical protein